MNTLRMLARLSAFWLAGSAVGLLSPLWLLALAVFLGWRRLGANLEAREVLSLLQTIPDHKGVSHGISRRTDQ